MTWKADPSINSSSPQSFHSLSVVFFPSSIGLLQRSVLLKLQRAPLHVPLSVCVCVHVSFERGCTFVRYAATPLPEQREVMCVSPGLAGPAKPRGLSEMKRRVRWRLSVCLQILVLIPESSILTTGLTPAPLSVHTRLCETALDPLMCKITRGGNASY